MERLLIVRHGNYDGYGHINENGRKQIAQIGEKIKATINGERVMILSSTAVRARESAQVLEKIFGVKFEEHEVLWSESRHPENLPAALELVRSKKDATDVLILVTHLEYSGRLPLYFFRKELEKEISYGEIRKGEAWDINCKNETMICVR